jgi:transposase
VATDKGYHSGAVLTDLHEQGVRSYVPEPDRGRRRWSGAGKAAEQKQVYANRRRMRGNRGKRLQKLRSELVERSFAHLYETGAMRRVHVRGRTNIPKRVLVHAAAFNLSLVLRQALGGGKPRQLQASSKASLAPVWRGWLSLVKVQHLRPTLSGRGCDSELLSTASAIPEQVWAVA